MGVVHSGAAAVSVLCDMGEWGALPQEDAIDHLPVLA